MAWLYLRHNEDKRIVQSEAILAIAPRGEGSTFFVNSQNAEIDVSETIDEVADVIAAAEEAEQRRNARIVAETQSVWATEAMGWKDRATEAQAQLAAARDERDAARAEAERLREALSKCRPIVLSLDDDWDFSDAELADAMAALKGAE